MNHTVLITGAAVRVGRAIALAFADKGATVLIHHHRSEEAAQRTAEDVERIGGKAILLKGNLEDTASLDALMASAFAQAPDLNVLVNCAAIFEPQPFLEMTLADYQRHQNINLNAPVFLTQAFAKRVGQGSVVNIVDSFITKDKTSFFAYLLAKKGLADFTRMAAVVLAPKIRVNAVMPGSMLPAPDFGEDYLQRKKATLPQQALPTVTQVAEVVRMLVNSSHLTGQSLYVDGGEQLL
jgi:pteridine reductase